MFLKNAISQLLDCK
jgi:hypothetical protein